MGGGGGSSNQVQKQEITQSALPEYARPYFEGLMQRASTELTKDYTPYGQERIADFTQQQRGIQQNILGQQTPGQFGTATGLASDVANRSIAAGQYSPGQFSSQQISGLGNVQAQQVGAQDMQSAQTGYNPSLDYFQMRGPQQFGSRQAAQYMSPFIQQALEPQMREAITSARRGQVAQDLGSARQGTYGGSRQLLASMERERNLGTQLGDIQSRGLQSAYESAQQQFERDRAAGMTTAQQNQAAALQTQQLGTQTGTQLALANLSNEQQARVNNQAQQFQAQGMNAENALRAALANQQTSLASLQANQQADLDRQRMAEQSRQFGSQQGLAGLAQAGQMGQTLANIGSAQSQADQARFGLQTSTAAQQQALNQQRLDQQYQDFLRQRDYPVEQMQQYSSLLRGVPVTPNTTATTYAPNASVGSQLLGGGLAAAGIYNTANRAGLI
jgi:hypothetical protein